VSGDSTVHRNFDLDRPFPLDALPGSVVHRDTGAGFRWLVAGTLILASTAYALSTVGASFGWTMSVLAVAMLFGAALLCRGVVAVVRQDRLSIDRHAVVRHRRALLGSTVHKEPLEHYRGVLLREILVQPGRGQPQATVVYQVSLVHPTDALSTTLLTTRDRDRAQRYHDRVHEQLAVPALTAGLAGFSVLSDGVVGDAREDVLTADTRLDRIPPELVLEPDVHGLGVTIDRCEMGWYSLPIIAGFPAALHWICTRTPMSDWMAWIVFLFTGLVALVLFSVFALDRVGRRRLELQDGHVDYYLRTPFGDLMRQRIDLADLHTATVRRDANGRPELSIEARERHVEIGGGLSLEALEWLRALLLGRGRRDPAFGSTSRAAG
jgi:hypothetical protein